MLTVPHGSLIVVPLGCSFWSLPWPPQRVVAPGGHPGRSLVDGRAAGHDADMHRAREHPSTPLPTIPLVALLLAVAACAQDPEPGPRGGELGRGGPSAADLSAACGAARFGSMPPDTSSFPAFTSWDEVDLRDLGGEGPYVEEFVSSYDWVVVDDDATTRVLFGAGRRPDQDPPHAYASLEQRDGRWAPVGWGQCRMEVQAEGWGNARFRLDPEAAPSPDDERIAVLATEMACTGGRPPGDREVRGVVVDETAETISVVILVEPPTGAQDCPGNPPFPYEIRLDAPLGDRTILDGSTYPPSPAR